jgi:hypothetical protein
MLLDQILEGNTHFFLNDTRVVDVAADTEKLGSLIPVASKSSKPARTPPANRRGYCDSLDVGNGGGTAEETNIGRERWF